jgi:plasmid stability protein
MPALVIKNLPPDLHRRLKEDAAQHHRSMTQEAVHILDQALHRVRPIPEITPYKGKVPLTLELIEEARREGRR